MKNILIYFKDDSKSLSVAKHIKKILEDQALICYIHKNNTNNKSKFKKIDLIIVVGGDGTFLASLGFANKVLKYYPPILGVNQGSLGFLTECLADEVVNVLLSGLNNSFFIEPRTLFYANINDNSKKEIFLNDIFISTKNTGKILNFDIYYDGEFISSVKADGVLISTPTGSTAHSLSAGGPILHPDIPAMLITPVSPHTLTNRPIVVSDKGFIDIVITKDLKNTNIVIDGQNLKHKLEINKVRIKLFEESVKLIRPHGKTYFDILRSKLSFGRRN